MRDAILHNRLFPEKVIKYLWDDAFKFNPEALDYTGWADVVYYDIKNAGSTNSKDDITVHNPKYRVSADEADVNGWKSYANWGKALLRIITTYKYNGVSYTACVKTTNKTEGTSTYVLSGGDAEPKENTITVTEGDENTRRS